MPIIPSKFAPPPWLRNGHLQTILSAVWPGGGPLVSRVEPERLELLDGDFLDLAWMRGGNRQVVILSHGLEGNADAAYIRRLSGAALRVGWDALAWNFRGCGRETNRLLRFYHSGETEDLGAVIAHAAERYDAVALLGISLGGNVTLKYLGEAPPHPAVRGAVAISAPVDLESSARELDRQPLNRIYLRRFIKTLVAKVRSKAVAFPDRLDLTGIKRVATFQEFDDRYTAPIHGFRDAADYWARSSSRQFLSRINVPTLLLNARDDPFLPAPCFPFDEASASASLSLEAPAHGGHVGFWDTLGGGWLERRVGEFLGELGCGNSG